MYLLQWKDKVDGKVVFLSAISKNHLGWGSAHQAKRFSSPEELIEVFNKVFSGGRDDYSSSSYWGLRTKIIYIHPLNIPKENQRWID